MQGGGAMKVQITISGPDGTVAAHLDYDITIIGCRDVMESAIADLMDAAGIPACDDDLDTIPLPVKSELIDPPLITPLTECDANLAMLRDGLLKADDEKKPVWERMINKALDERLVLMAEFKALKAGKDVKP